MKLSHFFASTMLNGSHEDRMMRRREFVASALGLPKVLPVDSPPIEESINPDYINALARLKAKYRDTPESLAVVDYIHSVAAADKLFFYEYRWIDSLAKNPNALIKEATYFAKRFIEGPDPVLFNKALSSLDALRKQAPSAEAALPVMRELYDASSSMRRAGSWAEQESSFRDMLSNLEEYCDDMRYGITYDHSHNIPARIHTAYAAHPEANAVFQREVARLREAKAAQETPTKPVTPTKLPNFTTMAAARKVGGYPIPTNYPETNRKSVTVGDQPVSGEWSVRIERQEGKPIRKTR